MKRISLYDAEIADVVEEGLHRRTRLLRNTTGNGTFSEERHVELIAREVERAQRVHASMKGENNER